MAQIYGPGLPYNDGSASPELINYLSRRAMHPSFKFLQW